MYGVWFVRLPAALEWDKSRVSRWKMNDKLKIWMATIIQLQTNPHNFDNGDDAAVLHINCNVKRYIFVYRNTCGAIMLPDWRQFIITFYLKSTRTRQHRRLKWNEMKCESWFFIIWTTKNQFVAVVTVGETCHIWHLANIAHIIQQW